MAPKCEAEPKTESEIDAPAQGSEPDDSEASKGNGKDGETAMAAPRGSVLHALAEMRHDPEAIREAFETGAYPYKTKIKREAYEKHKAGGLREAQGRAAGRAAEGPELGPVHGRTHRGAVRGPRRGR
jgi:hypothetical protein